MSKKINHLDTFLLSVFVILITYQPYYLSGKINLFELGLYLPGIAAVSDGLVVFRDFFHLRGPLELYLPAWLMAQSGQTISVLMSYFYFGTVLTLIVYVLIAQRLFSNRLFVYMFVPILVARTFPRVVFTYWGGMRFAFGALAIYSAVEFFRQRKKVWIVLAGIFSSCAFLTSVEVGVCAMAAIAATILLSGRFNDGLSAKKLFSDYLLGVFGILVPYLLYLFVNKSLIVYLDTLLAVTGNMQAVFNLQPASDLGVNALTILTALVNPFSPHFKHITPAYTYLFLGLFLLAGKGRKFDPRHIPVLPVAIYGFILYVLAFRNIETAAFEMALQPSKLLLFYLLHEAFVYIQTRKKKVRFYLVNIFLFIFIGSSLGYAFTRFSRRFIAFEYWPQKMFQQETDSLNPLSGKPYQMIQQGRAKGLNLPQAQADDMVQLTDYVERNTTPDEPVLFFDELGIYHFIVNRPFVGRFPMVIFSWLKDSWHEQFLADLKQASPKLAVVAKELDPWFEGSYFKVPANKRKYAEIRDYIESNYRLASQTPSLKIYRRIKN